MISVPLCFKTSPARPVSKALNFTSPKTARDDPIKPEVPAESLHDFRYTFLRVSNIYLKATSAKVIGLVLVGLGAGLFALVAVHEFGPRDATGLGR